MQRLLLAFLLILAVAPAVAAAPVRIVALVVAVESDTEKAGAVAEDLGRFNAQVLLATDPTDAELRSIVGRFVDAAADADVALVYLAAPLVALEGRPFVLPAGTALRRASDLFTRALPLSAFARAAATARGGAVFAIASAPKAAIPDGITALAGLPPTDSGMSPIMVVSANLDPDPVAEVIAEASRAPDAELVGMMRSMAARAPVAISAAPPGPVALRRRDVVAEEPEPVVEAVAAPAPERTFTPQELAEQERRIPRSAKRRLQRALRERGHYAGLIDGIFGAQTRAAISAFQEESGAQATGFLTPEQVNALN